MILGAALVSISLVPQSAGGDVASSLEKLKSASAADRAAAQLFLARNLSEKDVPALRAAAEGGDPETRRRLQLAIADDDAKIPLAVALAGDASAKAVEVGRGALEERLTRWCPAWTRKSLPRDDVLSRLSAKPARPIRLDSRTQDKRLDVALDQLARFAPGAVNLVLDPDLALSEHPREAGTSVEGPFPRALAELVRLHRAELEGFAIRSDDDSADGGGSDGPDGAIANGPMRPWIRVRRAVAAQDKSGTDWIADWCVGVAADRDPQRRAACARAIAATGWPGGIAWLESRAFAGKDDAALEGVLLAAGRGQPARSLSRPEVTRDLLGRMRTEAARPDANAHADGFARADSIARAIAAAGPIGPNGEDLAAIVADGVGKLPAREAWSRLVALEGMHASSRAAATAIDALLASADAPPPRRFQALRARASTAPNERPAKVEAPVAALAWAASAGRERECARLLVALGVPPPPDAKLGGSAGGNVAGNATGSAASGGSQAGPTSLRLAELEWALYSGEGPSSGEAAAARLLALATEPAAGGIGVEALADRTRTFVRQGAAPRFARAIAAAKKLPGADATRFERLEILSEAGDAALRARWTEKLSKDPGTRADLLALGVLAGEPGDDAARAAILRAIVLPAKMDDAVDAVGLALDGLRCSLRDDEALAFSKSVGEVAANGPKELRAKLRSTSWPSRRGQDPVDADELDRALGRSGL